MQPVILSVEDKNIEYQINDSKSQGSDLFDNRNITFPTNIKYIFNDPGSISSSSALLDPIMNANEDENIEHIIILNFDGSYKLTNAELLSEDIELLSFKQHDRSTSLSANDDMDKDEETSNNFDIELEVVSNFKTIDNIPDDMSLDDLIKLYNIQNEQIRTIAESL